MRDRIFSTFKEKLVNFLIKYKTKTVLQIDKLLIEEILRWPEPIYICAIVMFFNRVFRYRNDQLNRFL